MKNIIIIGILFLYGCGSEPVTKNGIIYSFNWIYEILEKKQLLSYTKRILGEKCEDLSKIDNQKLVELS